MTTLNITLLAVVFILWFIAYRHRHTKMDAPEHILVDLGDIIIVKSFPAARIFSSLAHKVKKGNIVKLQRANSCLTLFTSSHSAIDIWLSSAEIDSVAAYAIQLFPNAQYVEVI